jgi:hypothetical protein
MLRCAASSCISAFLVLLLLLLLLSSLQVGYVCIIFII